MAQLIGRAQRMQMQSNTMGTLEKSAAAGAGVYVLNRMVGEKHGKVTIPGGMSVDGDILMAVLAGLSTAGEYVTRPYVPAVVGRYGGGLAVDVAARGVVPVAGYSLLTGYRPGWTEAAKDSAIVYAGGAAGMALASQFLR